MTEVRETSVVTAASDEGDTVALLGATVKAARKQLDLSVQGLAQRAGVSLGLVSQLERGLGNPSLHSIQRLASALGVSVTRLLEPPAEEPRRGPCRAPARAPARAGHPRRRPGRP